jgi:ABC-type nitrate/sulfonate/bicarbonate transport system substrate-binding protein
MSLWLAKEGNYYEKQGLNVEVISIPGSSLAIQAMLSGELPIIQAGGAGPIQANLSGADTVIIATIAKKFNWWIFSQPNINRMEDLRAAFGTIASVPSRTRFRTHFAPRLDPARDITMVQTAGRQRQSDDAR